MKLGKLLVLFLMLTLSCHNNTTNKVVTEDTIKPVANLLIVDSNYLNLIRQIKEDPYYANYDTSLKGGFHISYGFDSSDQFLIYKKGQKTIDTIGDCSLGLLYKNLGYIGADFDNSFVFVQSFGSGNPNYIQLYDKETAGNLIKEGSAWIDVDTIKQVLLYSENDVPDLSDSMNLYDAKKNTNKKYEFPNEIFSDPEICDRIHLKNISDKAFTIEYEFNDRHNTTQKKYSR